MIEQRDALLSARVTYARWPRPSRTWTPGRREQRRWPAPPYDLSFQAPVSACRPEGYTPQIQAHLLAGSEQGLHADG